MGIKETPTNFRVYYTCMKEYYNKRKDIANESIDTLTSEIVRLKSDILAKEQAYKEEAEWCKTHGIEYNGQDGRVFLRNEYCYEIPLLDCHIPHGSKIRFVSADYRGNALRGKTNQDLLEEADYNTEYICKLPLDIRTKLNLCIEADKTLYAKFIRNENQKPINASKASWKNRQ